jgi:hypothetical protein
MVLLDLRVRGQADSDMEAVTTPAEPSGRTAAPRVAPDGAFERSTAAVRKL